MLQRGRKSNAALQLIGPQALERCERQRAPGDLSADEVDVWNTVINAEPADWFSPSNAPLLEQYCRHIVCARRIGNMRLQAEGDEGGLSIQDYNRLLIMQDRESKVITLLATKMRLSQRSTISAKAGKIKPHKSRQPWEG